MSNNHKSLAFLHTVHSSHRSGPRLPESMDPSMHLDTSQCDPPDEELGQLSPDEEISFADFHINSPNAKPKKGATRKTASSKLKMKIRTLLALSPESKSAPGRAQNQKANGNLGRTSTLPALPKGAQQPENLQRRWTEMNNLAETERQQSVRN